MKKLFQKPEEEFNLWQSFTDLMFGLLAIFIVVSLVGFVKLDIIKKITENEEILVSLENYNKIQAINDALEKLSYSDYFEYNKKFKRIEYEKDINFTSGKFDIPKENKKDLVNAGLELVKLLKKWKTSQRVGFKIIIEGRAANSHTSPMNPKNEEMKLLSYRRALSLYKLWDDEDIIESLNKNPRVEIQVSGSGLEGKGRYKGLGENGEDRNKRFIIQIVPYILK
jgi:hypothetical protein